MAVKKVGTLIKEARTNAGMTQEQLARKVAGATAADIGKAERGEKALTQEQLKAIAKATGVTQKSLLDAAKGTSASSTAAKKPAAKKPATAKKPAAKKPTAVTASNLTATEKKLVELHRAATAKDRKLAKTILQGNYQISEILLELLGGKLSLKPSRAMVGDEQGVTADTITDLLGSIIGNVPDEK